MIKKINYSELKIRRLKQGISQERIARMLNVSQGTVSRYENYTWKVPKEKLSLFCSLYKITPEEYENLYENKVFGW